MATLYDRGRLSFAGDGKGQPSESGHPLCGCQTIAFLEARFGKLMLLAGLAELVIGPLCLSRRVGPRLKIGLVAWMATNFLVYRVGLWCVGWHHPCRCMGSLAGVLHLSDQAADRIMKGLLAYLLVGSYATLLWEWRRRRGANPVPLACAAPV